MTGRPGRLAGVSFLNARYLDPTLGRFISVDPLVAKTGQAYAYGNNNPTSYSDPTGLCSEHTTHASDCYGMVLQQENSKVSLHYNDSGFLTSAAMRMDPGYQTGAPSGWFDITDEYRRVSGTPEDKAFLRHREQCQYNQSSCFSAAFLMLGGSAAGSDSLKQQLCAGSADGSMCYSGEAAHDEVGDFVIETLVTLGFAKGAGLVMDALAGEAAVDAAAVSYSPRIRARGVQDPLYHNFPYSYDAEILASTPVVQTDGSLLFRVPGFVNGKSIVYEIAMNPETRLIFHRMVKDISRGA
jgi:hypothetical protein